MHKDPTKTFIGGLVLGVILGAIVMYVINANSFISTSAKDRQARCGRAVSTMAKYSAGEIQIRKSQDRDARADAIAYCD